MKKNKQDINLKNFVEQNKSLFETEMPDDGHFERFQYKLEMQKRPNVFLRNTLKYAAAIIFLISGIFIYNTYNIQKNNAFAYENNTEDDFLELSSYYNNKIEEKNTEFAKLSCEVSASEKQNTINDLKELDNEFNQLLEEYEQDPTNEFVKNALISNYRLRINTLGKVINTLKKYC